MRVLLDHCVPVRLQRFLSGHDVKTARQMGWASLTNGRLLEAAAREFDVIVSVDRNIRHQQNVETLPIAVVVVGAGDSRFQALMPFVPELERVLSRIAPCSFTEITRPERTPERGR